MQESESNLLDVTILFYDISSSLSDPLSGSVSPVF